MATHIKYIANVDWSLGSSVKPIKIRLHWITDEFKTNSPLSLSFLGCFGTFNGRYRGVTRFGRDSLATNGLFTLRNRPILVNLSHGIKTPTPPLYWSKNISTDLSDSRGWLIWFEKNGIPEKNGKITSLNLVSALPETSYKTMCSHFFGNSLIYFLVTPHSI